MAPGAIDKITGCQPLRIFKKWFSKAAKSHAIKDRELCQIIEAVCRVRLTTSAGESTRSG